MKVYGCLYECSGLTNGPIIEVVSLERWSSVTFSRTLHNPGRAGIKTITIKVTRNFISIIYNYYMAYAYELLASVYKEHNYLDQILKMVHILAFSHLQYIFSEKY